MFQWDETAPLKRAKGETTKANTALRDYAHMGDERSLRALYERYEEASGEAPPTAQLSTLFTWSARYDWPARVAAWVEIQQAERDARNKERQLQIEREEWADTTDLLEKLDKLEETFDKKPDAMLLARIVRIRLQIAQLRRLSAGLPDRITEDRTPAPKPEVVLDLSEVGTEDLLRLVEQLPDEA